MIIDATDLLLGRMASFIAKKALLGEKIDVINCEKAMISGSKANVIEKYKKRQIRGNTFKGPFYPRKPNMFVRRAIRGMLPYKRQGGRKAYEGIKCYTGVPDTLKDKKAETIENAHIKKLPYLKYVEVSRICKETGAKW
ncbi:50S ribosomal protein L13 [Candidatus Woesearchaeota archaeon]|nr:50S ribosomal protein L13 [Candidatus Woesearchaeota archaeon]